MAGMAMPDESEAFVQITGHIGIPDWIEGKVASISSKLKIF